MKLFCIVCRGEILEKRLRRNAQVCSPKCGVQLKRMRDEEAREELRGNTCPLCFRYVPLNSTETALTQDMRLVLAVEHGNAARFA